MNIWVDADACPNMIKTILYRAADRTKIKMILVSNQRLTIPASIFIRTFQVSAGFDVADNYIIQNVKPGDLVITADLPLADGVIAKDGFALNPRGEFYSKDNIKNRLAMRNINDELRGCGILTGGPSKLNTKDSKLFANALDAFLTAYLRKIKE